MGYRIPNLLVQINNDREGILQIGDGVMFNIRIANNKNKFPAFALLF